MQLARRESRQHTSLPPPIRSPVRAQVVPRLEGQLRALHSHQQSLEAQVGELEAQHAADEAAVEAAADAALACCEVAGIDLGLGEAAAAAGLPTRKYGGPSTSGGLDGSGGGVEAEGGGGRG